MIEVAYLVVDLRATFSSSIWLRIETLERSDATDVILK
jgi:hypothetical protein